MPKRRKSGRRQTSLKSSFEKHRRRRLGAESLEPRLVLDSTVVFNELMYNPAGDTDATDEWIELYNQLAVDMDISEWRLDGAIDFTFPEGTIVPGRGYLLVAAASQGQFSGIEGAEPGVTIAAPWTGRLANSGEKVELYNNDGRLMNTVDYNDRAEWPVEPDGSGATLAKRRELTGSEDFENWTHSTEVGGTPGRPNFFVDDLGGGPPLTTLVPEGEPVTAFVPPNGTLGTTWTSTNFNDAAWLSGDAGVGYDDNPTYDSHIGLDVTSQMDGTNTSIYIRMDFTTAVDPADMGELFLQMKYDDGFVAYLNGTEVARANANGSPAWNSSSAAGHSDGEAVTFIDFNITASKDLLNVGGNNVLAIHGLNTSIGSSDFLISPKLGYRPPDNGGGGPTLDGPIPIAINELSPLAGNKFVVVKNFGGAAIDLEGMVLRGTGANGGDYVFPALSLAPNARTVVTEANLGFTLEPSEALFLYTADEMTVVDGQQITNRLRGLTEDAEWLYPNAATAGNANTFSFNDDIVINEIMYHSQPATLDTTTTTYADSDEEWIELYNRGSSPVILTGWQLKDGVDFDFPTGTVMQPGSYLVIAKDAGALALKYPAINIAGSFSGSLGNTADRLVLEDANENPVDIVKYHESGQWDALADGGGSSLELIDPDSDNSNGGSWAASDESGKASWQSYSGSKVSSEPLGIGRNFHEFVFGMLESGEVLIDNLSVKRAGSVEMIANGNFESTAVNASPAGWRFIGNHDTGTVIVDPDDPSNKVLHLVADGAQQNLHDHVEVTFQNGQQIQDGQVYTVSFDAKWVNGSRQMNTRLYFTRASQTFVLDAPQNNGTPGAQNSRFAPNIGPTYEGFGHAPLTPNANEPVTVTVQADDPEGVASMTLFHNINGGAWTQVPMTLSGGEYTGTIPGRSSNQVVQFYVQGTDTSGAVSTFPAAGPGSRALYEVNDGQGTSRAVETFRIVLTSADNNHLFSSADRMSNHYLGGTLIVGNHTAFYDVDVRQVGSRYIRPNSGYKIKFNSDDRYHDVHESIRFDINALGEILMKQMVNRAGGSEVSMYDDISYIISPQHSGRTMLLNLARYESGYLKEQFGENGTDGTKFELDDITYPTNGNGPNNEKTGTGVSAQDIRYRGSDPEFYRGQLLIKNNRAKDDFEPLVEFARVINLNGSALDAAIDDVMDVDLWMRHYATQAYLGNWDTYGFRRPKNLRIFIRPDDGKVIPLFWDADLGNYSDNLIYNGGETRLDEIRNLPRAQRLFWGHMWDLTSKSFNGGYAGYWINHYGSLGAGTASLNTINSRTAQARDQAQLPIPMVDFSITTNNGNPLSTNTTSVDLAGDGWIDVREIRLAGSDQPLNVRWTDNNSWTVAVAVANGQNIVTLEAFDFNGDQIGSDTITINSTAVQVPLRDALRITELNYHPSDPTAAELAASPGATEDSFEFIEFTNTSFAPINLAGVEITSPVSYTFPATTLAAGQRMLIAQDATAFSARYSSAFPVGSWTGGGLPNSGGTITVKEGNGGVIQSFTYDDADNWPSLADGDGNSLQVIDTTGDYSDPLNWLPSRTTNGSPGADGSASSSPLGLRITEVNYNPVDGAGVEFVELFNQSGVAVPLTGAKFVEGVAFDFAASPITTLQPGEYALVVSDVAQFNSIYGNGLPVAGAFSSGALSNGGERIILFDGAGNTIHDFVYDDENPWPVDADGNGKSLEIVSTEGDYSSASNWIPSSVTNGSPGFSPLNTLLQCDYTGGNNGCDLDDIDVLYDNAGSGSGNVSITSTNSQATFTGEAYPINPLAVAVDSSLAGGYTFDMFVDATDDILVVDAGLTVTNGNYQNEPDDAYSGVSDTTPPNPIAVQNRPVLHADSWITTPDQTLVAAGVLDESGTLVSHYDLTDSGAKTGFQFGKINLLPAADGTASATLVGSIQTANTRPVVDSYSYTLTIAPVDNKFDYDGNGVIDAGDIPGWLADASSPDNAQNPNAKTFVVGDVNLDGFVNSTDLGLLLNNFSASAPSAGAGVGWRGGDLNMSGTVDSTDLGLLLNNFGYSSVAAGIASATNQSTMIGDVNGDGEVSPIDALRIINFVNLPQERVAAMSAADIAVLDVDDSGEVVPLDALLVINRLNQQRQISPSSIDSIYADLGEDEEKSSDEDSPFDIELDLLG